MRKLYRAVPLVRRDEGMSLVEVVVAMVVLGIMASAVLGIILKAQSAGVNNRARIAAANLAAREIDILRDEFGRTSDAPATVGASGVVVNPHPLAGGTAGSPLTVDGTPYTVTRSVAWAITGSGDSACEGGSLVDYPTLAVTVSVTWPNMGSIHPVVDQAQLAPAKGDGVPTTASFIAVSVVDAAGDPNPGRGVRVTSGTETRTGMTDASGCAVIQVSPPVAGSSYTAELTDSGYVDVSNSANPSKPVGTLLQGQLNNSVTFAYDRAASLQVRVVDSSGHQVADSLVAGTQITIASVGATGDTVTSARTISGAVTTIGNLWPTTVGAYYGTSAPAGGYPTVPLAPGGTGSIDVKLEYATGSIGGMPAGTSTVIAVPGTGTCGDSGSQTVNPSGFTLLPGEWSFYARGTAFDCAPGPASQMLMAGANDGIVWGTTTLQTTGVPSDGVLWAVNMEKVSGTLTTCPSASYASYAINVDGARTAPLAIAAGDWYVFRTDGAAGGSCLGTPTGQYPKAVPYETNTVLGWTEVPPTATLVTSNVDKYRYVILSSAPVTWCNNSSYGTAGTSYVSVQAWTDGASMSFTVPGPTSGTQSWYAYEWSKYWGSCSSGGGFTVGTTTTNLSKSIQNTGWVGP